MWYLKLQLDYVESTYTSEFARTFVQLSAHVKTAVYQGVIMQLVRCANKWLYRYQKIYYDNTGNVPNKGRNFNTPTIGKMYLNVFSCD